MPIQMDTSQHGFEMFYKPWQVTAIKYLLTIRPDGANSRQVCEHVNTQNEISRASIINYLNAMVDDGILTYTEKTGKGGHHRIYTIPYNEPELKQHLAKHIIEKLRNEYPEQTKLAINKP